jgi:hypothetical protein
MKALYTSFGARIGSMFGASVGKDRRHSWDTWMEKGRLPHHKPKSLSELC